MLPITELPTPPRGVHRPPAPPDWGRSIPANPHDPRARAVVPCDAKRSFATVLFADVRGSMALSDSLGLEEWWSMMARLYELMSEAVHRSQGWIGGFTGDGTIAVFEARPGADSHARRACEAALSLRDTIRVPAADLRRERELELSVRIGINSGELLAGTVGGGYRRTHTVGGYAVALAKRMEALAGPDRIYLTENTAALVGETLELRGLGLFKVKGAPGLVGVHQLVGRRAA